MNRRPLTPPAPPSPTASHPFLPVHLLTREQRLQKARSNPRQVFAFVLWLCNSEVTFIAVVCVGEVIESTSRSANGHTRKSNADSACGNGVASNSEHYRALSSRANAQNRAGANNGESNSRMRTIRWGNSL